jgi:glycosyltransferase involved in cell wall biosynthesis
LITIILPIRNEAKHIKETLDSILNQNNINQVVEILIADGMSIDGTRDFITKYQKDHPNIILIDNPEKIVSTGFNRALNKSKGDIIIRIDGHCEIAPDYIQKCLECLEKINADCVGGATEHVASGLVGKSIKMAQSSFFGVGGVSFRKKVEKGEYVDTLAFGAYKREVFDQLGGYDEELVRNQDDEFNFRMIQNDMKIWLDPSIKSTYTQRNSFTGLFKQYFQYGFYKIRVVQKRRGIASWRHVVPGLFVLGLFTSLSIFLFNENNIPILSFCLLYLSFSLFATILGLIKMPSNFISVLMLPVTFFILHISYGLGFLMGFIYFLHKWGDIKIKDGHFDREQFTKNSNIFIKNIQQ